VNQEKSEVKYETMMADFKGMEMQKIRRMGMKPDEAENYYKEWSEKRITGVAVKVSGFTPSDPIEET
jgi:hypothetical protein